MKLITIVASSLIIGACSQLITLPSKLDAAAPLHHNISAVFVGNESGPVIWLCATQPRMYDGKPEEDHYLQYSRCPEVPID